MNGRIERAGEIDRYSLRLEKGERVSLTVVAAGLGSWLDSVLTVRSPDGGVLAENDDAPSIEPTIEAGALLGADSRLEFTPGSDGEVFVELADRFHQGGPEYGYRLRVGRERPDFSMTLLLGPSGSKVARSGGFSIKATSEIEIPFSIATEGRTGPITVRGDGLPEGVTIEPVTVRPAIRAGAGGAHAPNTSKLVLRAGSGVAAGLSWIRIVGVPALVDDRLVEREAVAAVVLDDGKGTIPSRPIVTWVRRFPLRVVGSGKG